MDYLKKNTYFTMRHGEAEQNVTGIIASEITENGDNPPTLTEKGIRQAETAGEELSDKGVSIVYSSPYRRAYDTAVIVAKHLGLEVITDDRLKETDLGSMDGKTIEEYDNFFHNDADELDNAPGDGETLLDVRARVEEFLKHTSKKYEGEKILIVSHGDPIWALESVLENVEGKDILKMSYHETGEYKVFGSE